MKKLFLIFLIPLVSACTSQEMADYMFAYFKNYERIPAENDASVVVESKNHQKALWVYADVYLDVYDECSYKSREDGYLGAIKVSSNPDVGLVKTASLPANKPLYLSFGEYQSNVSCGSNFKMTFSEEVDYKLVYDFKPGKGCNVVVLQKDPDAQSYVPAQNVEFSKDDSFGSYRKANWRQCDSEIASK